MSYSIGSRIKILRINHKISQEKMAEILNITAHRYSLMERGQGDISYDIIKKIADSFRIPTDEITKAVTENKDLITLFREENMDTAIVESVGKVQEIVKVFSAHEKLHNQINSR
ncbi:helix-turn-helix domain-containing protein [Anaerotalea alkaliphila]|uniref:Helix-turn-helix transcriptional regulator n=1 Tax=Anaerotalea alkaliphila TaxID=2662126 RepID=A0A7X5KN39_9FIRM|nr:helix-turn-helix transcriptional regulator [Anaerotalea alkaliphila]